MRQIAFFLILIPALYAESSPTALATYQKNPTLENLGHAFAEGMNNQDSNALWQIIDLDGMLDRIFELTGNQEAFASFRVGLKQGIKNRLFENWFVNINQNRGEVKYRRIIKVAGEPRPFVIIDIYDEGLMFLELVVDPKTNKIVDMFIYSNGEFISQTYAQIASLSRPESSNYFKRLVGKLEVNHELGAVMKQVATHNQTGNYEASYKAVIQLPEALARTRVISLMRVNLAGLWSEPHYDKELARLAQLHGDDPTLFFMLLDHYFNVKDFEHLLSGIERVRQRVGKDTYIDELSGVYLTYAGEYDKALENLNSVIASNPDDEDIYWFKVETLILAERYQAALGVVDVLEEKFAVTIDPELMAEHERYRDFLASKEFKGWRSKL